MKNERRALAVLLALLLACTGAIGALALTAPAAAADRTEVQLLLDLFAELDAYFNAHP
jgi:hypothetical protein